MKHIFVFFVACGIHMPSLSWSQEVRSDLQFKTIITPHFNVVVNAEQQIMGQHYAKQLEKAYEFLSTFLQEKPKRTFVIINDKWDVTNGYATRIPYPHIMVYPVLPGPQESLADMGDWALELVTHEYTHVLNFEPAPGFIGHLRPIFGNIIAPNILLPTWWKEGIAVYMESSVSTGGRLRSTYQDAMIRSWSLQHKLFDFDLAQVNEVLPSWPEGMRPYLFGSLMWNQMIDDQGQPIIDRLFQRHGGRVPYFVEQPAKDYFNVSYSEEYKKALLQTEQRAQKQIQQLSTLSPTKDEALIIANAESSESPTISKDGQFLALITKDDKDERRLRLIAKNPVTRNFANGVEVKQVDSSNESAVPGKIYDGPPTGSLQRVSWFHLQNKVVYDKIDWVNAIERYSDLYTYDIKTQKTERLTHSVRGREPAVSFNDEKIVFIQLTAHKTSLALLDLKSRQVTILMEGDWGQRFSFPTFVNEQQIIYSSTNDSGEEELWQYDLNQKTNKILQKGFHRARFPLFSKKGLLFTSSKNGAHNIYRSPNGSPLTHTLTSYFSFTEDPTNGDLYATKMTDKGLWVHRIPLQSLLTPNTTLPSVEPLWADRYPLRDPGPLTTTNYEIEDYSIGSTLWPQYWIPFVATTSNGILIQALTSGFDPLKRHQYNLSLSWDTYLNKGSFAGLYQNHVWAVPWFLQSAITNTYFASASDYQTVQNHQLGITPSLFSFHRNLSMGLSARRTTFETPSERRSATGPSVFVSYVDVSKSGMQISPENSKSLTVTSTHYLKNGNDLNYDQYGLSGSYYWTRWLPSHHVFSAKVNSLYTAQKISSRFGASTDSLSLAQDTLGNSFLMRGYLTGHFLGRNMVNTNLEYRFPIREINRGSGTDPFYVRRLHGAFILDGVATDGLAYRKDQKQYTLTDINDKFWSLGAELRLETTVGYVLPVQFVVYYYLPQNKDYGGDSSVGLTLQITQNF